MEIRILIRILTWFRTGTVTRFLTGILIGIWIPRLGSESQDLDLNPMIGTFIWYLTKSRLVSHRSLLQSVAQLTRWVELELDQIKVNPVRGSFFTVFSVQFWLWKASLKFFENETFKSYAILSFSIYFFTISFSRKLPKLTELWYTLTESAQSARLFYPAMVVSNSVLIVEVCEKQNFAR